MLKLLENSELKDVWKETEQDRGQPQLRQPALSLITDTVTRKIRRNATRLSATFGDRMRLYRKIRNKEQM
jgi:hypothetical protein